MTRPRIASIRDALRGRPSDIIVRYIAPWNDEALIDKGSVGLILSHSVLEHVADVDHTMRACAAWLQPDGWVSHQVDFSSHDVTKEWNGHWEYPQWAWRLVLGGRPYLINRVPADVMVECLRAHGFRIEMELHLKRTDGLSRERLARPWQTKAVDSASLYVQARLSV
ncbi:methyltransferase domain-containing protein [Methylobacterium durans]|uniref:methyltransferase domain-containing protein n=1 Tax=Methylobacterium durans TaxID=2202825 RepID=UPI003AAEB25B